MKAQIARLKGAQAWFLILAVLSTIMAVPLIGYLISLASFGLIHLLLLGFAIIALIFALRASAPRTGTLLVMSAVIPGIISAILMYNGIKIADRLGFNFQTVGRLYDAMYSGELNIFFVGFNIGIISWLLYLLAAILLFLNVSNVRMRYKDLERGDTFLVETTKIMRKAKDPADERVEQAMGFYPEYDEHKGNIKKTVRAKGSKKKLNKAHSPSSSTKSPKEQNTNATKQTTKRSYKDITKQDLKRIGTTKKAQVPKKK